MRLQANVCFYNWPVICDHSNSFISSSLFSSSIPTVLYVTPYISPFSPSASLKTLSFCKLQLHLNSDTVWCFVLILSLVWMWLCAWHTGSFELQFYFQLWFEGIFLPYQMRGWRNSCHFWYNTSTLKEFRDSLNCFFFLAYGQTLLMSSYLSHTSCLIGSFPQPGSG